jgi:hypothetical protein
MKTLLIAVLFSLSVFAARSQTVVTNSSGGTTTTTGVTNIPSFFSSAETYFTSFDTNYSWTTITIEADTGIAQATGKGAVDKIDLGYDLGSSSQYRIGLEGEFLGVGSAVNGAEATFGYSLIQHYDLRVEIVLGGGYDGLAENAASKQVGSYEVEPGLELDKKLTANTYAKMEASFPVYFVGKFDAVPRLFVGAGFTFP